MTSIFEFVAESRSSSGRSEARSMRREGKVPAILYGGGAEPAKLFLNHNDVIKHFEHEAVYSHVLDVKVDGKTEKAILKEIQRHPGKPQIIHIDFLRISEGDKIRVHVPIHCINEDVSVGVKKGGVVTHNLVDIEISCLPADLPEYIEVDLIAVDMGESVHLTEITLPPNIEIMALSHGSGHDLPVVSIAAAKGGGEDVQESDDVEEESE